VYYSMLKNPVSFRGFRPLISEQSSYEYEKINETETGYIISHVVEN
jgi:hypothetical protein